MGQNAAVFRRPVVRTVITAAIALTLVSAVAAWVAIGRLADSVQLALARTESALTVARDLADTTASSASELEQVVAVVGEGVGNTSTAVAAVQDISRSVRGILDLLDFIGSVDDLQQRLRDAESQLVFVQGSLNTASSTLIDAGPALHETVLALAAVPAELDAALVDARVARDRIDDEVWLWRLGVVTYLLAVGGGLFGILANGRRVDRLLDAVGAVPTSG